jgi:hypothetical protein
MRPLGIIPDKILHQLRIEIVRFIDIIEVEIDTLLLYGTIKPFKEAI